MSPIAIVTGGSRGIGLAIVKRLAKDGFDVAVCYNSNEAGAREGARAVEAAGRKAAVIRLDISDAGQCERAVADAVRALGGVDCLINNAGVYNRTRLQDLTVEEWDHGIAVNLSGAFYMSRAAIPHLKKSKQARIINVSSVLAHRGSDQGAHYTAAKAGILGLTKSLARELAPHGITVNTVAPGATDTAILARDTPEKRKAREKEVPLGRIGRPEDIAAAVAYLCAAEASYVTGQTIDVNGGLWMA